MSEEAVMEPPKETKKSQTAQEKNSEYNKKTSERKKRKESMQRWVEAAKISRVSYVNSKVCISYSVIENNSHNGFELESDDEPSGSFTEALQALAPFVAEIVFRDKKEQEYQANDITVKSVNFKEHDEGNMHAGIGTTLTLSNGKATALNIPQMPLHPENRDLIAGYSEKAAEAIDEVLARTRDYMAGRRAQGRLFDDMDD